MRFEIYKTKRHGLEVFRCYVNKVFAAEFLSEAMARTFIEKMKGGIR